MIVGYVLTVLIALFLLRERGNEVRELKRESLALMQELAGVLGELEVAVERNVREQAERVIYLQELSDAKSENDNLRLDLDVGAKRLSIRAACPTVPVQQADRTSGAAQQTCELDAGARRAYLDLRERIADAETWIRFCHKTVLGWGSY